MERTLEREREGIDGQEEDEDEGVSVVTPPGLCGVGRRYRALLCTRDDGVLAHPRCVYHHFPLRDVLYENLFLHSLV